MIGITLSSEFIRTAPIEVQRWIEQQVSASIRFGAPADSDERHGAHLVTCSEQSVTAILTQIQSILPAVNVLFELGRDTTTYGRPNVPAFRLIDIAHHTRLQNEGQVAACLEIINRAFVEICGNQEARLCGLDRDGYCFVASETQQNIKKVWQNVVAAPPRMSEQDGSALLDSTAIPPTNGPTAAAPFAAGNNGGGVATP